jgi:hypothetical protein
LQQFARIAGRCPRATVGNDAAPGLATDGLRRWYEHFGESPRDFANSATVGGQAFIDLRNREPAIFRANCKQLDRRRSERFI